MSGIWTDMINWRHLVYVCMAAYMGECILASSIFDVMLQFMVQVFSEDYVVEGHTYKPQSWHGSHLFPGYYWRSWWYT